MKPVKAAIRRFVRLETKYDRRIFRAMLLAAGYGAFIVALRHL